MKNRFKIYAVAWAVALIIYIVLSLVLPGVNYIALALTVLAFCVQLGCAYFALKEENLTKVFYGIATVKVSYTGLIITAVVSLVSVFLPISRMFGAAICLVVLLFTVIAVLKAHAAAEIVGEVDEKVKIKTSFIKSLTADALTLSQKAKSTEAKAACKKVYEAIRYSDPVSNAALYEVENRLSVKFGEFAAAVTNGGANIGAIADEVAEIVAERNNMCKLMK